MQAALAGPRHDADLTPPLAAGFQSTFAPEVQKNDVFLHISENVDFVTPYSFFFFGFLSLCYGRRRRRGRILEAYAIPPTPLEVASDFLWIIRFSEYYSQRFQREVRQLNSLSEFLQRFEEIQVYQLRCKSSWSAFEPVLEGFGAILEPSWSHFGPSDQSGGHLGAILEPSWSHSGPS